MRSRRDIRDEEFSWPIGAARVLFCINGGWMVLLHAFIKKSQKTPPDDLALAVKRKREIT